MSPVILCNLLFDETIPWHCHGWIKKQLIIVCSTNFFHLPKRKWHFLCCDASISTPISVKSSTCLHTIALRDENLSPHYCFHYARCCPPGKVVALQEGNFYLCGKKEQIHKQSKAEKVCAGWWMSSKFIQFFWWILENSYVQLWSRWWQTVDSWV